MTSDWSLSHLTGGKQTTDPDVAVARLAAQQWGVLSHYSAACLHCLLKRSGMIGRILNLSVAPTRSHPEDFVLNLVLQSGLQHPDVNAAQRVSGRKTIPDLRWSEQRLVVEVDSREWHSDPLAQRDDADRQARLEAEGWRVVRVTTAQAERDPLRTIARLRAAGAPDA